MTVVLDLDGNVVMPSRPAWLAVPSNDAWLDDHTLLCEGEHDFQGRAAVDVFTGHARPLDESRGVLARSGHRFVSVGPQTIESTSTELVTSTIQCNDEQPWLEMHPRLIRVDRLEFA
jgi:hypothetical protein